MNVKVGIAITKHVVNIDIVIIVVGCVNNYNNNRQQTYFHCFYVRITKLWIE